MRQPFPAMIDKCIPFYLGLGLLWLVSILAAPAHGLETRPMRTPDSRLVNARTKNPVEDEATRPPLRTFLLGGVRFFQRWISPIDGSRCGFTPTCSQFGYEAVSDQGALRGIVMTSDRLMRCSYLTDDGPDYPRLPNGSLSDPVANNLLGQP